MSAAALLKQCRDAGVTVRLEGGLLKLRGAPDAVAVAKVRLKPHKPEIIRHLLDQFRLDDCAGDPEPELIARINRMAFELMQHDGIAFDDAIRVAAEIALKCVVADCEAAYADVQALWRQMVAST